MLENETQIKLELKKELIVKSAELDNCLIQSSNTGTKVKEYENKTENLKLMLVQSQKHFQDFLTIMADFKKLTIDIKESDEELLEAIKEAIERHKLDKTCMDINSISERDKQSKSSGENSMNCDNAPNNHQAILIPQMDENPEKVYYDYLKEQHLRKIEKLQASIEKADIKVEEVEAVIKKIQTLDQYKFQALTDPKVDINSMPFRNINENRDSVVKCRLITAQLNSIFEVVQKIVSDIREGRFEELKQKLDSYENRKGRLSEVPQYRSDLSLKSFKADDKENEQFNRTQVKMTKRSKHRTILEDN